MELIVTVVVVAILSAVAFPAVLNMVRDNSVSAATNQLVASLNYARNAALTQHSSVTLCQSTAPTSTSFNCNASNASNGYAGGWVVYTGIAPSLTGGAQPTTATLLKFFALDSNLKITANGSSTTAANVQLAVTFTPMGMLSSATAGTVATSATAPFIVICDDRGWARNGLYARVITVSPQGRIASALGTQQSSMGINDVSTCTPS